VHRFERYQIEKVLCFSGAMLYNFEISYKRLSQILNNYRREHQELCSRANPDGDRELDIDIEMV
jgi:hypothetical protein